VSFIWYLLIAGVWAIQIYLVVRCFRRGRWGWGLAGMLLVPPAAWVGAFLPPVDQSVDRDFVVTKGGQSGD
jgi:hypothetical protein